MDNDGDSKKTTYPPPLPSGVLKLNHRTPASKFNRKMIRTLADSLSDNPETNLLHVFPTSYARQLEQLSTANPKTPSTRQVLPPRDTRTLLKKTEVATIISPLADEVQFLLDQIMAQTATDGHDQQSESEETEESEDDCEDDSMESNSETNTGGDVEEQNDAFLAALLWLLDRSEMLFQYPHGFSTMVLRITDNIVAKLIRDVDNTTEYSSLEYLRDHAPGIPAPRPHGLIRIGRYLLMFSSFIPGEDLDKIWPKLNDSQKRDISSQIDAIFSKLRSLPRPPDLPLGGVKGEGCKDIRRWIRHSATPIMTPKDFEEFIFSKPTGSSVHAWFLKSFIPADSDNPEPKCVFTHSDLRPANIRVVEEGGRQVISGIIDWEFSGFYPDYWESLKITNTMGIWEKSDWYQYLPESLSPLRHARRWLLDRIWDQVID